MRRLRQSLKRAYYLRRHTSGKDEEGNTSHEYAEAVEIQAIIRHASGQLDVAAYGEHMQYILKMQYEGDEQIAVGDGICVYVGGDDEPDYQVKSVKGITEDAFRVYELEAI